MATVLLSPSPILQFFNNSGQPNAGGSLLTQVGGVNYPTYQDSAGTIPLPNPIPLNARGEVSNSSGTSVQLFLTAGVTYTFTLYDANNNQLNQSTYVVPLGSFTPSSNSIFANQNVSTQIVLNDITDKNLGSSYIGYDQGGTGAVARTIQSKLQDSISVKDFGAVGDGTTDDTSAIQAAITYAETKTDGSVFFPDGNYKITSGITFASAIGIDCSSSASITASANTFPAVTLAPANYSNKILKIPSISGGSIGLYLYGTALAQVYIANIANCVDGLVLALDNTNKTCADNVVTFTVINSCSGAGIKFAYNATTTSGTLMQGNQIKGNFVTSTLYGTEFYDINNGSLGAALPWDDTEIDVFAVDGANIANSIGIYGNPLTPPGRVVFRHKGFFGGFTLANLKGINNNNIFEIGFSSAPAYSLMQQGTTIGGRIINYAAGQGTAVGVNPVALSTTYNSISTFNGGNPLSANRNAFSFTLSSPLTAGQSIGFYFYHPFMTGYNEKITAESTWDAGAIPLIISACNGANTPGLPLAANGNSYPFQGFIQFYALGAVPAGTYYVNITVHDAPV